MQTVVDVARSAAGGSSEGFVLPSLEELIQQYGYWAILVGTFFEGETILVLGGLFAYQGHLNLATVMLVAFTGTLFGDQFFFYMGRRHSDWILNLRPGWAPRMRRVSQLLHRYQNFFMLTFRFYYGLRAVIPFTLGVSMINARRFLLFNFIGAVIWSVTVGFLGYLFGEAIALVLEDVERYKYWGILLVVLASAGVWAFFVIRKRLSRKARELTEKLRHPGADDDPPPQDE